MEKLTRAEFLEQLAVNGWDENKPEGSTEQLGYTEYWWDGGFAGLYKRVRNDEVLGYFYA